MTISCDRCREDKIEKAFSPSDIARSAIPLETRGRYWRVWCRDCRNSYNLGKYTRDASERLTTNQKVVPTSEDIYLLRMQRTYGLHPEDYRKMLSEQGGVCKICGLSNYRDKREARLCVDHNHTTGRVRGLLCYGCNNKVSGYEKKGFGSRGYAGTNTLLGRLIAYVEADAAMDSVATLPESPPHPPSFLYLPPEDLIPLDEGMKVMKESTESTKLAHLRTDSSYPPHPVDDRPAWKISLDILEAEDALRKAARKPPPLASRL